MTGLLAEATESGARVDESAPAKMELYSGTRGWNKQKFAYDQIQAMVRQVFLYKGPRPAQQVAFSAVGSQIDIDGICRFVGKVLSEEGQGEVAVVQVEPRVQQFHDSLRAIAVPVEPNLWLLSATHCPGDVAGIGELRPYLDAVRADFQYSILVGSRANPNAIVEAAKYCDGLVLVLSALHTRRATALYTKHALEQAGVRLLGTVLVDREFPIPQYLYRRL